MEQRLNVFYREYYDTVPMRLLLYALHAGVEMALSCITSLT